jgi:predicted nuclease with TOPRIM domain
LAGSYDLVNLIADCNDFYEPQLTELRYRNEELASNLESMARKNEQTQANYKHVMKTLTMLEFEQLESATEKKKILTESQNLRNRLEELAKSENKAHYDLSQIQTQILSKE